jgi:hypothetical protein
MLSHSKAATEFPAWLHRKGITWGELCHFEQVRCWVGFLVEWKQGGE